MQFSFMKLVFKIFKKISKCFLSHNITQTLFSEVVFAVS